MYIKNRYNILWFKRILYLLNIVFILLAICSCSHLSVSKEQKLRDDAVKNIDRYRMHSYRFLNIDMFKKFNNKGLKINPLFTNKYCTSYYIQSPELFKRVSVILNKKNKVIGLWASKSFESSNQAGLFFSEIVNTFNRRYNYFSFKRVHNSRGLKFITVNFDTYSNYIRKYIDNRKNNWSFYDNIPNNLLHEISLAIHPISKKHYLVIFEVISNELSRIETTVNDDKYREIKQKLF